MLGFDIQKTIQASACLLSKTGGRSSYMRLLKLLYIADRTSLEKRKTPIIGDTPVAMKQGPVPSATLDIIKGNDPASSQWNRYIQKDRYDVCLREDPGNLSLSRAELKILDEVSDRFSGYDEWELVEWCHENLPEYQRAWDERGDKNQRRIDFGEILDAIGRADEQQEITDQINESAALSRFFSDHMPTVS